MANDEKPKDALAALFPGRTIQVDTGSGIIDVVVYPLGFKHLRKFSKHITGAILALVGGDAPKNAADQAAFSQRIMSQIIPYVIDNLLDLVAECTVVKKEGATVEDLPHWCVAEIASVWVIESFGEEKKWRPWVTAVENVYATATGSRKSISEIFSKSSSSPATVVKTS